MGEDVGLKFSNGEGTGAGGGGSMVECVIGDLEGIMGSGKAGMASSDDEVSIVMLVVDLGVKRRL